MTYKSIEIYNYRSIKELKLELDDIGGIYSKIFLGKNESGKSSILKALSIMNSDIPLNYQIDCNKDAFKNKENIGIVFKFNVRKNFLKKEILECEKIDKKLLNQIEIIGINKYFKCKNGLSYNFNVVLLERLSLEEYVIDINTKNIYHINDIYDGIENITKENIEKILPDYKYATSIDVNSIIREYLTEDIDKLLPKTIFWNSTKQYLINEPINLNEFKNNCNSSIVLKNIFNIANISDENIPIRLNDCLESDEEREELAEILSEEVSKHINSIWKEHNISFKITIESDFICRVNIFDNDNKRPKYKMEQRSDGFKQFISILLILSAENKANSLKNSLILLDEPEVHLHPSGIKYLRDELFEIAKNNIVLIATHSTYMIDKINLDRHYSVIKNKSITEVTKIEKNNPYQEEVIYEALGTSVYEHIEPNVIIFEGKTDKDAFDIFKDKFKKDLNIKNITTISADGVTNIPKYVKFFNNKLVNGFILVDSDSAGRNAKESILKENSNLTSKNTFEINDIYDLKKESTLEDLFPKDILENVLLSKFSLEIKLDENKPFMFQIKNRYKNLNEKDYKMAILEFVTKDLNSKETVKNKKEKYQIYFDFVNSLYSKINVN